MELITVVPNTISGFSLLMVGWVIQAILTGRLLPRKTVEDTVNDRDARIQYLEALYKEEREGHNESRRQASTLVDTLRVADRLLDTLREQSGGDQSGSVDQDHGRGTR